MIDYKKEQEKGFEELKEILREKGETETIKVYVQRLGAVVDNYVVCDLNWELIHCNTREMSGDELETFLQQVTELIEEYDE